MVFSFAEYWVPFVWGMVMVAGFLGWGELARWGLGLWKKRVDWGLLAGWGMAGMLMAGGWLQTVRLCNQAMLTAMALAGAAGWGVAIAARWRAPGLRRRILLRTRWPRWLPFVPAAVLAAVFYVTSVQTLNVNRWDDLPAYLVMAKRLAQTGILLDPFSVRRILTYGGQQMFDAMLLAKGSILNIDLLELGVAKVVFAGLVMGLVPTGGRGMRGWWRRIRAGAIAVVLLLVPVPFVNIQSEMTGVVLFITLLRTMKLRALRAHRLRRAAAAGVVAAGAASLRMNFVPAAILAIGLSYWAHSALAASRGRDWKAFLRQLCTAGAAFIAGLLPWSIVLYRSSGTFLYPLMRGTQRPEYDYLSAHLGVAGMMAHVWEIVWRREIVVLVLPMIWVLQRRYWRVELPFYLAVVVTSALTLFTYTLTGAGNMYRFLFPALFAVAAAVVGTAVVRTRRRWQVIAACVLAWLLLWGNRREIREMKAERRAVWNVPRYSGLPEVFAAEPEYRAAQSSIPAGARMFVAVTYPSLFDYGRNTIYPVDMIGGASPAPGMPIFQGAKAVSDYLKNLGIGYVAYVDPDIDDTHMSRAVWSQGATHPDPAFRRLYPFNLAFMNDMEELGRTEEKLYRGKTLTVVRLK